MSDRYDVFVGNLTFNTTEEQLRGPVKNIRILLDKESGKPKGFAFVEYFDTNTALSAIRHLDQTELNSRKIKVGYPAQSNLKDVARQIGQVVPESSADNSMSMGGSSSIATRMQIEQSVISSLKLHEAWDLLEAMKKLVSEDNNRGQKAKAILQTHPQLINAIYEIQKKLGIPLPKHIQQQQEQQQQQQLANISVTSSTVDTVNQDAGGRFFPQTQQQQQLLPGDVRAQGNAVAGSSNVGNIKAGGRSHQQQQNTSLHDHPYQQQSTTSNPTNAFQTMNQQPPHIVPPFNNNRQQRQQYTSSQPQQYLPPQQQLQDVGYNQPQAMYGDNSDMNAFNPYLPGGEIHNPQQQQYNNVPYEMLQYNNATTVDPNMMMFQQQNISSERRSRFSSNTMSTVDSNQNNVPYSVPMNLLPGQGQQHHQHPNTGMVQQSIPGPGSSELEDFNASLESYLMGGRPPNMMMHHHQ